MTPAKMDGSPSAKKRKLNVRKVVSTDVNFESPPITVEVGDGAEKRSFYLLQDRLIKASEYFKKALSKEWKEGQERKVRLTDVQVDHFKVFALFISNGTINTKPSEPPKKIIGDDGSVLTYSPEIVLLLNCWKLADRLCAVACQDACVDALAELCAECKIRMSPDWYTLTFKDTPKGCGLRKIQVDMSTWTCAPEILAKYTPKEGDVAWQEYVTDVAYRFMELRGTAMGTGPWLVESCRYHQHAPGEQNCYRRKLEEA